MNYHSKTGFSRQKFFQFLHTTVSVSKAEELLFRLFPLEITSESHKGNNKNNKSVAENSNVSSEFKADLRKIKMAIRHALCSTSYPTDLVEQYEDPGSMSHTKT